MPVFCIFFLLGNLYISSVVNLPIHSIWLVALSVVVSILFAFRQAGLMAFAVAGLLCGATWSSWYASHAIAARLPLGVEGKLTMVDGTIASIPITGKFGTGFLFFADRIGSHHTSGYLRLNWNTNQHLRVGDRYQFAAHLKRIHGLRNEGTFNYESWALQNHIIASGSVDTSKTQRFIAHQWRYVVNQMRQHLHDLVVASLPDSDTSGWILALTIGERYMASHDHWQILRATGTNHLMAIAGLHIGLISGFVHMLGAYLWRQSIYLCYLIPAQLAAACLALGSAWFYSALAGFALPTQRACVMVSMLIAGSLSRKSVPVWQVWACALLIVLVYNPFSSLSESFWLSFFTIAVIIYGMQARIKPRGWWWKWCRVQWVIGIGLVPLALYFFQQTSVTGFIANSIVIPWLGFVILPLCLLACVFLLFLPYIGHFVLIVADKSLALLWWLLGWFASFHYSIWTQPIYDISILISVVIACMFLLAPRGMPGRILGIIWLLPLLCFQPEKPDAGNFWFTLLDVGQGLSAVIETKSHVLVYDAGARFSDKMDMGESVVVPYLRSIGINKIDMLVISHGDNDHAGGMDAILHSFPVHQVRTGELKKLRQPLATPCLSGFKWTWDDVLFQFIYPSVSELDIGNNSSCVLKVDNGKTSVLLTGDIEKYAEKQILKSQQDISANIMTAPHHGSKTSGLRSFLSRVNPQYVVIPAGYRNRYRLPHKSVMNEYARQGVLVLNTAGSGAVQFKADLSSGLLMPWQYRYMQQRYWE